MQMVSGILMFFSVLMPARVWFAPTQPIMVNVKSDAPVMLVLSDMAGKVADVPPVEAAANKEVDLRAAFPKQLGASGTYVVWAVPKGKSFPEFVGTPIVVEVRSDKRAGMADEPIVVKLEPLRYAVMSTDQGDMTWVFYYDIAPNTASTILTLCEQGFYEGLTFHRILPGFVIQGGDPHGDGVGGPGFSVDAEFSMIKHEEGILSMARSGDPLEQQGMKPRCEWANSAGSQFFVCLGPTPNLDGKYTAFGKVVDGLDTVKAIAATPLVDKRAGKPQKAPVIKKVSVFAVTPEKNPYAGIMNMAKPK